MLRISQVDEDNKMIKLSENIRKYRLQKEMTQSQFASVFNVSEQAVSRWENGNTFPDITLLPALADYFGITIDELMGMENYKDEKEIDEIIRSVKECERKGLITESITILQKASKKYPTNYTILLYLAEMLNFENCLDDKQRENNHLKSLEVADRIINECHDRITCDYAINAKLIALRELGRIEEAVKIAEEQPNVWNSSNFRLMELYHGDDLKQQCKNNAMQFAMLLYYSIKQQADLGFENDSYTIRERINISKKALEVLEVVYEGDYGLESRLVAEMNRIIAAMEVLEGNTDATLDYLEKAAKYAIEFDTLPERIEHISTLLKGYVVGREWIFKNHTNSESEILYEKLKQDRYDCIRETEAFKAIVLKLTEYVCKK